MHMPNKGCYSTWMLTCYGSMHMPNKGCYLTWVLTCYGSMHIPNKGYYLTWVFTSRLGLDIEDGATLLGQLHYASMTTTYFQT